MKLLNNLSIKSKLVAIVITATLLSVLIGTTIFVFSNLEMFKVTLVRESLLVAEVTGENCQGTLEFNYPIEAEEYLKKLRNQNDVEYACLFDKNSNFFAEFKKDVNKNYQSKLEKYEYQFDDNFLHVYSKIYRDDVFLGTLYLMISTENLSSQINKYLLFVLSVTAALTLFTIIIALRLQSIISKPILTLADTAVKISELGDYSLRVKSNSNDEIAVLYNGFNNMLKQNSTAV